MMEQSKEAYSVDDHIEKGFRKDEWLPPPGLFHQPVHRSNGGSNVIDRQRRRYLARSAIPWPADEHCRHQDRGEYQHGILPDHSMGVRRVRAKLARGIEVKGQTGGNFDRDVNEEPQIIKRHLEKIWSTDGCSEDTT